MATGTIPGLIRIQSFFPHVAIKTTMKPEDLERLVTVEMPFGKHKGCIIADLPGNYLNWFAREGFPNGEIGRLLRLMQEIDHNGLKPLLSPLRTDNVPCHQKGGSRR